MGNLGPPELIIIALVIVLLFGASRLPATARALGRSMRIFKAETKGLREDSDDEQPTQKPSQALPPAQSAQPPQQGPQVAPPLEQTQGRNDAR
ncbi:MAG TPA: Sec-independent protein translocase subunit TatA [Pseudonocardiaceae bacterium]|nr:Sec-independent protein translocase subunit TatA [Pseudonocardiaceae bacterium]